jgi:hypothetical protein
MSVIPQLSVVMQDLVVVPPSVILGRRWLVVANGRKDFHRRAREGARHLEHLIAKLSISFIAPSPDVGNAGGYHG